MNCSLNSLKEVLKGIIYGTTIGVIKEDIRSLDNGTYGITRRGTWVVWELHREYKASTPSRAPRHMVPLGTTEGYVS